MKRFIILIALLVGGWSMRGEAVNIGVLPTPQRVVMDKGTCNPNLIEPTGHWVDWLDSVRRQEGAYVLKISKNRIDIYHSTAEGYENALKTFRQIKMHYPYAEIPCMTVTDWPAFRYRGWMDDVSRGPVVNEVFAGVQQRKLAKWKMNFGSYYTEHTLYNKEYADLTPNLHFLNVNNIIDDSLMANLQCLAHFEKTLRIPYYEKIMDSPCNVNPGEEETYSFLRSQIRNTWDKTPRARYFNIDCDETEAMGTGRGRDYVSRVGADSAYCQHIRRVYDIVMDEGKKLGKESAEVLMWGDIVAKNPAMLSALPKEMNYIIWSYAAQESYEGMIEPFSSRGLKFWVASGVSHWSSLPLVDNYIKNIANLARDGYKRGAIGVMCTSWDDSGESLFGDSWHAMAWAAEMAWHPITSSDPEELRERERVFNEIYAEQYGDVKGLYALGALADNRWVGEWFNTGTLYQPLLNFYPSNTDSLTLVRCDSVDKLVNEVLAITDSIKMPHVVYGCHRLLTVSMKARVRVMLYNALNNNQRSLTVETERAPSSSETMLTSSIERYFDMLHSLKREYLRLWDGESTPYSREIICERYDELGREVQQAMNHVFITNNGGKVEMKTVDPSFRIYYTTDGRKPSEGSMVYSGAIEIDHSCLVQAMTMNRWGEKVFSSEYMLAHKGMGALNRLNTHYSDYRATYSGGGDNALADGILGSDDSYADGHWQGYCGDSIDLVYDFGKTTEINEVSFRALQKTFDWILAPTSMRIQTSTDGINWTTVRTETFNPEIRTGAVVIHTDAAHNLGLKTRWMRVVVPNPGKLPEWHPGRGNDSYIFVDEVVIE